MSWWPLGGRDIAHASGRDREWEIAANWALYVDNYLEGFHIPFVHGDLNATLDHDRYRTELFDGGVLQMGIAREGEPRFDLPEESPDHGQRIAAFYWWLFPGLMLNFYPWGLSVNLVSPEAVDSTRVVGATSRIPSRWERGLGAISTRWRWRIRRWSRRVSAVFDPRHTTEGATHRRWSAASTTSIDSSSIDAEATL